MTQAIRIARRELRGGLGSFRIFLACLALGVAAIAAVGTVSSAIDAGLEAQGARLLGGDAEAELTYRFAREDELAFLNSVADRVSETVDFRSMVTRGQDRGLTQVRAVDDAYPLIGAVTLVPDMPLDIALAGTETLPGAVMEPLLADRMGLVAGDTFKLGLQEFIFSAVLESYPDNAAGGFGLGPRTIVLTKDLANSGLISEGTLFSTEYRLDLPENIDLAALAAQAETEWRSSGMRWRDARNGAGSTARFVDRIGDFLILVGLAGLAVGGVGVSAAVRSYIAGKTETIATLRTLGATRRTIFTTYALQIGILSILGIIIGLVLGAAIPLILQNVITAQLPIPANFRIFPEPLLEAAIYGVMTAAIFTLWPLARTEDVKPASLFREAFSIRPGLPALRYLIITLILIAALVTITAAFSGTIWLTLWSAGGIMAALTALVIVAVIARYAAKFLGRRIRGRPALRLAFSAIGTNTGETSSVVLSLGLGLAVLASVGQIDGNLQAAFDEELPAVAPSYFFVDIQPDQIDGYLDRLKNDPQVTKFDAAPMLRGIITRINGRPAKEVAGGHWVLRGDRGITYSIAPPEGTLITAGEWWEPNYTGAPQVSFSTDEANEMGLQLGDEITVNVLGRDITATITSFRKVEFQTAGIGFILAMNPAALSGAPHSWISTVYAEQKAEAQILRDIANAYPNITAIRIRDAIDQALILVSGIAEGVRYGALVTLITGFLVLIGAASAGQQARTYEAAILKTLGASRARIMLSFAFRAFFLGLAAASVALCSGLVGGWAVITFIMEDNFQPIWGNAISIIVGGILATLLANLAFAIKALQTKPAQTLRARE